jgi:hypothetical protein
MAPTLRDLIATPDFVEAFEIANNDLWQALRACSVDQLKRLVMPPLPHYQRLLDALIVTRTLMGE